MDSILKRISTEALKSNVQNQYGCAIVYNKRIIGIGHNKHINCSVTGQKLRQYVL